MFSGSLHEIFTFFTVLHHNIISYINSDLFTIFFSSFYFIFATLLEEKIEQAIANGGLKGKEMFFSLWLSTPVTLPFVLSREKRLPLP